MLHRTRSPLHLLQLFIGILASAVRHALVAQGHPPRGRRALHDEAMALRWPWQSIATVLVSWTFSTLMPDTPLATGVVLLITCQQTSGARCAPRRGLSSNGPKVLHR